VHARDNGTDDPRGAAPRPDSPAEEDPALDRPPPANGAAPNHVVVEFSQARRRPGDHRPTEDEELLNRPVPSSPRPKAPELATFTHTDPWRVLRIQGEFVHGFNALAEVGASVALFGSARTGRDHPDYAAARALGRALAEAGFAVITGGGPGLMEAANRGAREGGGLSIGCNIELPFEQAGNPYATSPSTSATSSSARRCSSSTPTASSSSPAASAPWTSCSRP
jgi:hypothetical protein